MLLGQHAKNNHTVFDAFPPFGGPTAIGLEAIASRFCS